MNSDNYIKLELTQIAGLKGIIPYWLIATASQETQGISAWNSLKEEVLLNNAISNSLYSPNVIPDDLNWTGFHIGEFYGLIPRDIIGVLQNSQLPKS